jgi:hypothetical protein
MKRIFIMLVLSMPFIFLNTTSFAAPNSDEDTVKTLTVRVGNLLCNGDMPTIKKHLLNEEGIDEVSFTGRDSESSEFTIKYHSSATSPAAIEKVIESTPGCDAPTETPYKVIHPRKKKNG